MSAGSSTQSYDDASAGSEGPFFALLQDMSPYIDEVLAAPEFHRFLELPIELRCKIYEQYFIDNKNSIICKTWPYLRITRQFAVKQRSGKTAHALIPNLCLVSKALQDEQLDCLFSLLNFDFEDATTFEFGLAMIGGPMKLPCLQNYIRNVSIRNVNGQHYRVVSTVARDGAAQETRKDCEEAMFSVSTLLRELPRVRQLSFEVCSPLWCRRQITNTSLIQKTWLQALPIAGYLGGFEILGVLTMKALTRLTIIGQAGHYNCHPHVRSILANKDFGNTEHLQGVIDLARQIKDGFSKQNQDVLVEVRLMYGRGKEDVIILA
ncbi:hypothetical protein IQ06DRAFT_305650 [Phaeosphaeriaceae sp. SRC1lsM3a]|nr:hypothetical protein IQ06DRAFT_305650 [Stagonospora sp. SRC1lsM3a]